MTNSKLNLALTLPMLMIACAQTEGSDADRRPLGKADLVGSCRSETDPLVTFCGGQSEGSCWCNDSCPSFGDCCEDKATVCAAADPRSREGKIVTVDLTNNFSDIDIDFNEFEHFLLRIPSIGGKKPTVAFEDGGQCLDVFIADPLVVGNELVFVYGAPDFNLDDGLNSCILTVTRSDSSEAKINLFIEIDS